MQESKPNIITLKIIRNINRTTDETPIYDKDIEKTLNSFAEKNNFDLVFEINGENIRLKGNIEFEYIKKFISLFVKHITMEDTIIRGKKWYHSNISLVYHNKTFVYVKNLYTRTRFGAYTAALTIAMGIYISYGSGGSINLYKNKSPNQEGWYEIIYADKWSKIAHPY